MKITAEGKDVTSELGKNLEDIAQTREYVGTKHKSEVLKMTEAETEQEYSETHLEVLRTIAAVDTAKIAPSGSVRKFLWRVLRSIFDQLVHNQNNVNAQLVHAMEMEKRERDRQLLALRKELDDIRKKS